VFLWQNCNKLWITSFFLFVFYFYATDMFRDNSMSQTQRRRRLTRTLKKKLMNTRKTKISEGYDLLSEPCFDTNWCEPHDHVVTQPTIKIKIWSQKAKRDVIGVWHNDILPQGTNKIRMKSKDTSKPINLWYIILNWKLKCFSFPTRLILLESKFYNSRYS
jgi:hypothetical protein